MRKICILIMVSIHMFSCTGINHKSSSVFYENIPTGSSIYLRSVKIMPEVVLTDISSEIPELIRSCLQKNGFSNASFESDNSYKLDISLNSRNWQYQYKYFESVTLSMRLYRDGELCVYNVYTEDTEKSIESFAWTLDFIERNINDFAMATGSDE